MAGGAVVAPSATVHWRHLEGFLHYWWHGPHALTQKSTPEVPNINGNPSARLNLARAVLGGQFEILLCSTNCLRELLLESVGQLEQMIDEAKTKAARDNLYRHGRADPTKIPTRQRAKPRARASRK
jgi:hypothetical protein